MTTPAVVLFCRKDGEPQANISVVADGGPHNPFGFGQCLFNFINGMHVDHRQFVDDLESGYGVYALGADDAAAQLVAHLSNKVSAGKVFIGRENYRPDTGWFYKLYVNASNSFDIEIYEREGDEWVLYKRGDAPSLMTLATDEADAETPEIPPLLKEARSTLWFLNGYLGGISIRAMPSDMGDEVIELHGGLGVPLAAIEQGENGLTIYEVIFSHGNRDEPEDVWHSERATAKTVREAVGKAAAMCIGMGVGDLQEADADKHAMAEMV